MSAPQVVLEAVQAAIVASAHQAAYEHVAAAAQACRRLGGLTSGRWRSVARDLDALEADLQTAFADTAESLEERAATLGIPEDALWSAGDAAATLDLLRESALEEVDETSPATRLLEGQVLYGVSFVEDASLPDRGTTLLFGWPEPLAPATWPWQASWVVGDGQQNGDTDDELDLYEAGELEGEQVLLAALAEELETTPEAAQQALRDAAQALTRASLLAGAEEAEGEQDAEEEANGEA